MISPRFVIFAAMFSSLTLSTGCMSILPSMMPTVDSEQNISAAFPFDENFADVLGSKMHYVDVGEGTPIVLLHGNPTSSYLWRNVIPHLENQGRVIAVDLIGMGKSEKPDLPYRFADHIEYFDAFMTALDLKDVILVLHDWGGGVGFDYAMRHQDNVKGIVFMEAVTKTFSYDNMSAPEAYLFKTMRSDDGDALLMDDNYFVERLVPAMSGRELTEEEMKHYRAPYLKRSHRKPARVWPLEVPLDGFPADNDARITATYEKLRKSSIPLLLLYASPGAIINERLLKELQTELPRMKTVFIGPGVHYVQETQPTAIGKATKKWLQSLTEDQK